MHTKGVSCVSFFRMTRLICFKQAGKLQLDWGLINEWNLLSSVQTHYTFITMDQKGGITVVKNFLLAFFSNLYLII